MENEWYVVSVPSQNALYPNFPNPFNASTQITYALPKTGKVSQAVFNILGDEVVTFADEFQKDRNPRRWKVVTTM